MSKPSSDDLGGKNKTCRADVISFLTTIYESVAEVMPDSRDTAFDDVDKLADSYSIQLNLEASAAISEETVETPAGSKMPRKKKRQVVINPNRPEREVRKLPPGYMKEYYEQYRLVTSSDECASFPSFWRVTCLSHCL